METKKKVPMLNKIAYALGTGGGNVFSQIAAAFLLQYYTDTALTGWILAAVNYDPTVMQQSEAVVNAVKFDYTWLGAIFSVILLGIVLMLNVEKYADQYRK